LPERRHKVRAKTFYIGIGAGTAITVEAEQLAEHKGDQLWRTKEGKLFVYATNEFLGTLSHALLPAHPFDFVQGHWFGDLAKRAGVEARTTEEAVLALERLEKGSER